MKKNFARVLGAAAAAAGLVAAVPAQAQAATTSGISCYMYGFGVTDYSNNVPSTTYMQMDACLERSGSYYHWVLKFDNPSSKPVTIYAYNPRLDSEPYSQSVQSVYVPAYANNYAWASPWKADPTPAFANKALVDYLYSRVGNSSIGSWHSNYNYSYNSPMK
ncbi:hypothetical protein PV371_37350 [Streptomyces sp. TX20-6-3]|uniref:hypothetical protein n=1 Tax=Streptomyces sp. TX20-6-3 TaxID=3028705 RepID=UPI0029BD89AB|nr:hypothetical protein [Streptomyces sp. TX20-6-3]MDX2565266.1 hypothetical protein [Streptomyces sp. TX20-6-3]